MSSRDILKIEVVHYKLDTVTDEAFEKYINEVVTPKWVTLLKRHNVLRYTSTITPSTLTGQYRPIVEEARPGWKTNEAHLTLTYYVPSIDVMKAIIADPENKERGRDVEVGWIDTSRGEVKFGWETVYIENGEVVNTVPQ